MSITLENSVIIPAKTINSARITNVALSLYEDGQSLSACSAFVAWSKGNVDDDGIFTTITSDNYRFTAEEVATLLVASQSVVPTENLLPVETPMDKIFVAIVQALKEKGKM